MSSQETQDREGAKTNSGAASVAPSPVPRAVPVSQAVPVPQAGQVSDAGASPAAGGCCGGARRALGGDAGAGVLGGLTRRGVLAGAAGVAGLAVLAACGSDDSSSEGSNDSSDGGADDTATGTSSGLVALSDVPVGGGLIVTSAKLVVTQPEDGEVKAFSSTCTHQGCQVNKVSDGKIGCPCHGSEFSVADGSVLRGPATAPLPDVPVKVEDGQVIRA